MSEVDRIMRELEREKVQLEMREKNLESQQKLAYAEHLAQTATIRKVSAQIIDELTKAGHICVRGEQIARIEEKANATHEMVKEIREAQKEIKSEMETLFEGRNSNSKRIDRIETVGSLTILGIGAGWAIFLWLAEKLVWK